MTFEDTVRELTEGGPRQRTAAFSRALKSLVTAPALGTHLPPLAAVTDPELRRHVARLHAIAARGLGDAPRFATTLAACTPDVQAIILHELGNDRVARVTFRDLLREALTRADADVRASALYAFGQWAAAGGDTFEAASELAACLADHRKSAYHKTVVSIQAERIFPGCVRHTRRPEAFGRALDAVDTTDRKTKDRVRGARAAVEPASPAGNA